MIRHIREMPPHDRPREKLVRRGPLALSKKELIMNILGSSHRKGVSLVDQAISVVSLLDNTPWNALKTADFMQIHGIGTAQATRLFSALRLGDLYALPKDMIPVLIQSPEDALPLLANIRGKQQEYFVCMSLNGANELIKCRTVTIGLLNSSQVHPREVYADVLTDRAASIILAHNHPSGTLCPSESDIQITNQLVESGRILGIGVLDHMIVSLKGYRSMKEHGYM